MLMQNRVFEVLGPLVGGRAYPLVMQCDAQYPAIVYQFVSITEEPFVDAGQLIQRYRVQVKVYSPSYDEAASKRDEVIAAMRAMPEFMEQVMDFDDYEAEDKLFVWTMDIELRDL
jgi:hypothetical protein